MKSLKFDLISIGKRGWLQPFGEQDLMRWGGYAAGASALAILALSGQSPV